MLAAKVKNKLISLNLKRNFGFIETINCQRINFMPFADVETLLELGIRNCKFGRI